MRTEKEIVMEIKELIPDPNLLDQEIANLEAEILDFLLQGG